MFWDHVELLFMHGHAHLSQELKICIPMHYPIKSVPPVTTSQFFSKNCVAKSGTFMPFHKLEQAMHVLDQKGKQNNAFKKLNVTGGTKSMSYGWDVSVILTPLRKFRE